MTTFEEFNQLIAVSPLSALSGELHQDLYKIHELYTYSKNQEVFRSHSEGRKLFFVASGNFRLFLKNGRSKDLEPGEMFGEIAALTEQDRLGSVSAVNDGAQLISFAVSKLREVGLLPQADKPDLSMLLFKNTAEYLHELLDNSTETLLMRGENEKTEFKEGANNPNIVKSIAGFLNTQGGTLLIGVNDEGEVLGIPEYSNHTADKYDQDLQNLIREKIGPEALSFVHFCHSSFYDKGIYRINIEPSDRPMYAKLGRGASSEAFVIRSGATNQQLSFAAALQYIARRFPGELLRGVN